MTNTSSSIDDEFFSSTKLHEYIDEVVKNFQKMKERNDPMHIESMSKFDLLTPETESPVVEEQPTYEANIDDDVIQGLHDSQIDEVIHGQIQHAGQVVGSSGHFVVVVIKFVEKKIQYLDNLVHDAAIVDEYHGLATLLNARSATVDNHGKGKALAFDPSKCSKLSMEQKRELVYEVSNWSDGATEMLHSWSRQEILQILCAELGKERKYTGLTKSKIIEHLLKIVYEKKSQEGGISSGSEVQPSSENGERTPKRQRKSDQSNRLPIAANGATTSGPDIYSPICSWRKQLVVARDTRRVDILCYRLSLAQKILAGTKHYQSLCGDIDEAVEKLEEEVGPLTGLPVKKARGIVNRLSSGPEIQRLCASVVESLDLMLSKRVSDTPSDCNALASKLVRIEDIRSSSLTVILNYDDSNVGNVMGYMLWHRKASDIHYPSEPTCRLFAPNMKFLLSSLSPATDYFLKVIILDKDRETGFCEFQFRTGNSENEVQNPNSNSSEVERSQSPATNCSSLSNPSSVEDETNNVSPCGNDDEIRGDNNTNSSDPSRKETNGDVISLLDEEQINCDAVNFRNKESSNGTENGSNTPRTGLECVPFMNRSEDRLQITPYKMENCKDGVGRKNKRKISGNVIDVIASKRDEEEPQAGSSSKKRSGENRDEKCNGIGDKDFEYYVKVIRWLECDGHIETTFRQKFLTWYSLRATPQEVRIVKVFIDTFIEDPESLAGQLVDTFSDVMSNKRCSTVPSGFCLKLWH
ncbi:hypothetical protein DH2020_006394 [Rehmannia glutinosa]|uniref:Fibronectin type-III domain-containing protein n=1 Tax=Rehmannia glutinosa TaxID=99300 RepID=A0ABR0XIZ9_REHGL